MKRVTDTKSFIEKAKQVHGNKYDYSKVEYVDTRTKVCIICPEHGEFWQRPILHLKGHQCKKCAESTKLIRNKDTKLTFIKKAIKKHGNKFDYSKVDYKNSITKVCIMCPEHGDFKQTPQKHLLGHQCPLCANIQQGLKNRKTLKDFVNESNLIHNNKYDYSQIIDINGVYSKVPIICKEHGVFIQKVITHLSGSGCPKCAPNGILLTNEEFISRARQIHGWKYDYSKIKYVNSETKVLIICPEHGEFYQTPHSHLKGYGCTKCNESQLEREIRTSLEKNNIQYTYEKKFVWLGKQSIDFYLPDFNIGIECQGRQHFEPVDYFGGNKHLEKTEKLDIRKNKLCKEHNVRILYYTTEDIMKETDNYIGSLLLNDKDKLLEKILSHKNLLE